MTSQVVTNFIFDYIGYAKRAHKTNWQRRAQGEVPTAWTAN